MRVYIVHFVPRNALAGQALLGRHCYVAARDKQGAETLGDARKRQGERVYGVAEIFKLDAVAA